MAERIDLCQHSVVLRRVRWVVALLPLPTVHASGCEARPWTESWIWRSPEPSLQGSVKSCFVLITLLVK